MYTATGGGILPPPFALCSAHLSLFPGIRGNDHPDIRAHAGELAHDILVAALNMVDIADLGRALGRQALQ